MAQVACNLTDHADSCLRDMKFMILDSESPFAKWFCSTLEEAGVKIGPTAFHAPDITALADRWVQTEKRECLSKLILLDERHLRWALPDFTAYHHEQRPHQGLDNLLIALSNGEPPNGNRIVVDGRLGGLLRSYRRAA